MWNIVIKVWITLMFDVAVPIVQREPRMDIRKLFMIELNNINVGSANIRPERTLDDIKGMSMST